MSSPMYEYFSYLGLHLILSTRFIVPPRAASLYCSSLYQPCIHRCSREVGPTAKRRGRSPVVELNLFMLLLTAFDFHELDPPQEHVPRFRDWALQPSLIHNRVPLSQGLTSITASNQHVADAISCSHQPPALSLLPLGDF
ncbi:hypothetical protein GGI35DRAFT_288950 [Trichoderma velutinum]